MTLQSQWTFLAVVFVSVFVVGLVVTYYLSPDVVRERLHHLVGRELPTASRGGHWVERFVKLTGPLARLSIPDEGWEHSPLRIRFMNAGFRGPSSPMVYFSMKTILALGLPAIAFVYVGLSGIKLGAAPLMGLLAAAGALGYYAPNLVLSRIRALRQREILEAFPDALDLMTICVEAGLGLDAALLRVADEISLTSPVLSEELHLVTLELRAGSAKEKALRNLALRTGVEDVDALVAMLVQADRFGTSIADSLRVHSDSLRTKRRQRAEETAAKIPVKLLFPLIFCIFPAMLVVLMGPSALRIVRAFSPVIQPMQ